MALAARRFLALVVGVLLAVAPFQPGRALCDTGRGIRPTWQHHTPMLCPIAKIRLCWSSNATHVSVEAEAKVVPVTSSMI